MAPPFHRLLAFFSNRSIQPDTQTIRFQDSLRGNLALGLNFPVAFAISVGRHLWLKNTGFFSLNIHVPSVAVKQTPLDGIQFKPDRSYTCAEIVEAAKPKGWSGQLDALGLWALASDVRTGKLDGEDVKRFQEGSLFEQLESRRRDRSQVVPFRRGGPIGVGGHSWFVKKLFGVDVYQKPRKGD